MRLGWLQLISGPTVHTVEWPTEHLRSPFTSIYSGMKLPLKAYSVSDILPNVT